MVKPKRPPPAVATLRARVMTRVKRATDWVPTAHHRMAIALGAIAVVVYVTAYPFFVVRYPPITDLPMHATAAAILRHYGDPAWHFHEQFVIEPLKVPYWTYYLLGALFALGLPMVWAMKLATIAILALLPAGLAVFFYGMRRSPLLGLVGLAFTWNTLTHWGFINFVGAVGLFAMTLGLTMMVVDRPTRTRQWLLAAALLAVFATHIFRYPFAAAAVVGTAIALYPSTRRIKPVLWPMVPSLVLFAIWYVVRDRALKTDGIGPIELHWGRFKEIDAYLFNGFVGTEERVLAHRTYGVVAFVGWVGFTRFVFAWPWRDWSKSERLWHVGVTVVTLACVAVFLAMYLMLPMQVGDWWYIYPREILAAAFIALGLMPDLPTPGLPRLLLLGLVAFAVACQAFYVAGRYQAFDEATDDFEEIKRRIPPAPRLGYIVFDNDGSDRAMTPFVHLPGWVQAEKGGWLSFNFVGWNASPVKYRADSPDVPPPCPTRFEWQPDLFDVATRGKFFDVFLARSVSAPDATFGVDPSIRQTAHVGTWWLYERDAEGRHALGR
jgi:hypothetical protein